MTLIDEAQDVIIIDQKILEAAQELRERIEQAYGIKTQVDISLWYPPEDKIKLVGYWDSTRHEMSEENPSQYPYTCFEIDGNGCTVTIYVSEKRQDGMLK